MAQSESKKKLDAYALMAIIFLGMAGIWFLAAFLQ